MRAKQRRFRAALWGVALVLLSLRQGTASVVINELCAGPSERIVDWARLGGPGVGTGTAWTDPDYSARGWTNAPGPVGFGDRDDQTIITGQMLNIAATLYLRQTFVVTPAEAQATNALVLRVAYDDGYIAWLNGVQVATRNLGDAPTFAAWDQIAYNACEANVTETFALATANLLLRPGTNVLAVQAHNCRVTDNDLTLIASLTLSSTPARTLVAHSNDWCYYVGRSEPSGGICDLAVAGDAFLDWIELCNTGATPVALAGWAVTDEEDEPWKWRFPAVTLTAGEHLVVLCSDYVRADPTTRTLHTGFSLDVNGEYLALREATGELRDAFTNGYPAQSPFYSYGRRADGTWQYCALPTPGAQNSSSNACAALLPTPQFSLPGGCYTGGVTVTLACADNYSVIRYTLDGSEPQHNAGWPYIAPLHLTTTAVVRARAFAPAMVPSRVRGASYLFNMPATVQALPIMAVIGDPRTSLYEPHGIMAVRGGYWSNGLWRALAVTNYNNMLMHGRAFDTNYTSKV